ncbi:MAG: Bacterial polymerase, alpha chain terminal domain [Pseudomonadota bacterium]
MANEQPANKTKAKAAFLKQANHFVRLGTATDQDVVTLIDSIEAMLASVLKKPISIQIASDANTVLNPTAEQVDQLYRQFKKKFEREIQRKPKAFDQDLPADDIHIDLMGLSVRAMDALNKAGVSHASQIAAMTKAQLSQIKGIGTKTIPSIIDALQKHGLTLVADHV